METFRQACTGAGCDKWVTAKEKFCSECGQKNPYWSTCIGRDCNNTLSGKDKFCSVCGIKNPNWRTKCSGRGCEQLVAIRDHFCSYCGTKNPNADSCLQNNEKYCPVTGVKNLNYSVACTGSGCFKKVAISHKFCLHCGTKNPDFPHEKKVAEAPEKKKQHLYEGTKLTADYTDEKWIARHRCMYDKLDRDGNGFVTLDEFVYKASVEICGEIGATAEQTERHTQAVTNFFTGAGMKFGVEQLWPEYIKGWEPLIESELAKWERKEMTLIREWGEAIFDIIDKNGNGSISLEEWENYQRAAKVCDTVEDCAHTFAVCDRNGDGKIEIDEMTRQHVGFWYIADPSSDGLYGPGVP